MREYRLTSMPTLLKKELAKQDIDIIEEKFNQRKSWLLYVNIAINKLLDRYGINYTCRNIKDTGWDKLWKNYLEDGWLTEKVYYCFDKKICKNKPLSILINPSLAFGTGGHVSTQIAARLLEKVANRQTVLDIGTGSGILAILASITGANKVFACDVDALAITNAKENIGLNRCKNIYIWTGGINSFAFKAKPTVIVTNIVTSVLIDLHPQILMYKPKYIIYSGILLKETEEFVSSIHIKNYQPDALLHMKEWCGMRFKMI